MDRLAPQAAASAAAPHEDPATRFARRPKITRPVDERDVLTGADVRALLTAPAPETPHELRNRAMLATAYRAALRSGELVALAIADVDLDRRELVVRGGDGARQVGLDAFACDALERWMQARAALGIAGEAPLFCAGRRGGRYSRRAQARGWKPARAIHRNNLRQIMGSWAHAAGLAKPVSAEALRRARVRELADAGAPLPELQALLGHRTIDTTREYLERVAPDSPSLAWQRPPAAERGLRLPRRGERPPNYGRSYPPEVPSRAEIVAMIGACDRGAVGLRNRALIVTLWRAGLRIAEALELRPKDVDGALGVVAVLHGKGDKRRLAGIDPQAVRVIEAWLDCRAELGIDGRAPLFCKVHRGRGGPLRAAYVRDALRRAAARAGVEKRVHPHALRHAHAFELANEGTPLHVIRAQLGHTRLSTTERYINHLAPIAVIRHMQARSWDDADEPAVVRPRVAGA